MKIMKIRKRKGQVLLIAVMLLATVITVIMTIAFNSSSQTQVARLEADSQKALAAAEAGVDAVIQQSISTSHPIDISTLGHFSDQKITGNAQVTGVANSYFVSPLLQKDGSYTFYLSDYPGFASHWSGSLNIYFVSEGGCPSIEVTVVKNDYTLDRYAYNTCSSPAVITNASLATISSPATTIDSVNFSYKTDNIVIAGPAPAGGLVMFVRVLNGRTKLGFKSVGGTTLPFQGKTVESEARTASGVVKKVQLFQSFPQIPSNFFMTSF